MNDKGLSPTNANGFGSCVPDFRDNINTFHPSKLTTRLDIQAGFRTDGRCGKDFGEAQCDPEGVYGGCCSYYG